MRLETSTPTTVRIAKAARRSGCSSHTGAMAAGGLIHRKPGSTVVCWSCEAWSRAVSPPQQRPRAAPAPSRPWPLPGWPAPPWPLSGESLPHVVAGPSWLDGPAARGEQPYRLRPPRAWPAATPARRLGRLRRDGRGGLRLPGQPPGVHPLPVLGEGRGGLLWGAALRRGGLLGPWTRMPHEPAPLRLRAPPRAGRHRHGPEDAVPMPLATRFVRAPPRLLSSEGQGRVRLAPRFPVLAYRPGAWHQGSQAHPLCQAQASSPPPPPPPPPPAQGAALLDRDRGFPTVTRLPIPPTAPPRPAALTAHAQPQAYLCAIATPVFPRPIGRAGAPGGWGAASYLP